MLNALSVAEQRLALLVMALLVGGLGVAEWRRSAPVETSPAIQVPGIEVAPADLIPAPAEAPLLGAAQGGLIDLNTADAALLEALPGVGPAKAAAIVGDRAANGPFASVADLDRVSGFGEKTVERLAPYLTVGALEAPHATAPAHPRAVGQADHTAGSNPGFLVLTHQMAMAEAASHAAVASASTKPPVPPPPSAVGPAPLNINTATAAQFEALDGIGPVLAQRIVAYRAANGPFRSVDELDRVKGIGPAIMARNRHRLAVH